MTAPRPVIYIVCLSLALSQAMGQQILNLEDTRHDLALYLMPRQSDITQDAQCIFCHLPEGDRAVLGKWDQPQSENLFDYPYDRPSEDTPAGKPDGSTLVCLSCHDGTIALGDVLNRTESISQNNGITRTDLSDGHPVSLLYDSHLVTQNNELEYPDRLPQQIKLDTAGKVQCTTCHDPHDDSYGNFLVMDNSATQLCTTCHKKTDWETSTHSSAAALWNLNGMHPWPYSDLQGSVAEHGCFNCHTPHTAGNGKYLLSYNNEEDNCMACHNGNVAEKNISADFNKLSHHPVENSAGIHEADEDILIDSVNRHVECTDCHDPHALTSIKEEDPFGPVKNISGIDVNGIEKPVISRQYELCFRCHGDSPGKRAMPVPRVHDQNNIRLQFDNGNPSFHPVVGPGNSSNVPSLIAPLIETSMIQCTDCHSSDSDTITGAKGPDGPHGSIYPYLLVRSYRTQDRTPESPTAYALCYLCHDRQSILGNESFPSHRLHIGDENTPCSICHDPHGISSTQGNESNNSHLINFDVSVVSPNQNNQLYFEDRGSFRGSCFLYCHNSNHDNFSY